ncbi:MAG: hypothetical protein P4M07_15560, partial [Xanthobacteraceae bacterium]|nr:hypothetical protein [Xanthobacteraceae bacterium]
LALERVNELADLCRADFDRLVGTLNPFEARHIGGLRWADVAGRIALRSKKLKVIDGATFDTHFKLLVARALKDLDSGDLAFQADVDRVRKALISRATFPFEKVGEPADKEACANGFRRQDSESTLV